MNTQTAPVNSQLLANPFDNFNNEQRMLLYRSLLAYSNETIRSMQLIGKKLIFVPDSEEIIEEYNNRLKHINELRKQCATIITQQKK